MKKTAKCYSYLRFSSTKQKDGDSARRQIAAAEKYAKANGLELDNTLNMKDEGLSGFTGKHIKEGNLGKFLALIEAGKIAKGSRLIVESVDRLGRQEPFTATDVIKHILRSGIMLVVLDWYRAKEFTAESIRNNPGELSGLVAEIERAYFESKRKSERLSEAWEQKRHIADNGGKKLTAICPFWLEPIKIKDKNNNDITVGFDKVPKYVLAVQKIFKLKSGEDGNRSIARTLNDCPDICEPPRSKNGWAESTIQRIVHDRRVLGEYQPCTKNNGKREPVGEPIEDYYPSVIEEELFYAVQNRMKRFRQLHGHPGGRADKAKNVFTHVIKCGKCGSPMHFIDKGNGSKGGQYLHCSNARQPNNGKKCKANPIHYNHFLETFLKFTSELKASDIHQKPLEHQKQIDKLSKNIDANGERIEEMVETENKLLDLIVRSRGTKSAISIQKRMDEIIEQREEIAKRNEQLILNRIEIQNQAQETQKKLDVFERVTEMLANTDSEEEAKEIRLKIRSAIQQLFKRIVVFPSEKTTGRYDRVLMWFNGTNPYARVLFYKDRWRILTRTKPPKTKTKVA